MRVTHDDGPYHTFSDVQLRTIFGYVPIEPAMDNQITAFRSKKISEKSDAVSGHKHAQVERCFMFSWWVLFLYRFHDCNMSNFNVYVDENGKHNYDTTSFHLT